MTKTTTIRIDAAQYQDHDDCLAAATDDAARKYDLEGWDLNARWEDDQREGILIDIPEIYEVYNAATSHSFGFYRAGSAEEAMDLMHRDAGYKSTADARAHAPAGADEIEAARVTA